MDVTSRRRFLVLIGVGLGAAACGPGTTAPPPATTAPPTPQAAASSAPVIQPVGSVSPAQSPAAVAVAPSPGLASPAPSPAAAVPSPSAAPPPVALRSAAAKPMYQQDAQHTGRSPYAGPRQPKVLRTFDTSTADNMPPDAAIPRDDFQSSSVIGADGTIYVANFPGVLFALRDSTTASDRLDVVWRFHPPAASSFHATPALSADGSSVYLGFAAGGANAPTATLYALKAASTGSAPETLWTVDLGAARVMASPTVGPDGTVYVATSAGQLFAVGGDGKVRWTATVGPAIKSAPALGPDGTVYQPSSDGKMYAVSSQGQAKWAFEFGAHLGSTPVVTSATPGPGGGGGGYNGIGSGASPTVGPDGTIYIGANNSNLYAVRPDGGMKWLFEAERELAGIWTTPVLSTDGSTLYFGANKGGIYAVKTADGTRRWQFPVYGSIYASSVMDNRGVLYTGTTIEHIYAVNSASGEQLWDLDVRNQVWSAPSLRPDSTLVIADRGGVIQVIG